MDLGVYKIENKVNNRCYIGSAKNLNTRKYSHFTKLQMGIHPNQHLQLSYNKYGKDNFKFEILETVKNPQNLIKTEQYWINLAKHEETKLFNKRLIAESNLGYKQSKETIEKRKKTNKINGYNYGRGIPKSIETIQKIIKSKIGQPHPRKGDIYTLVCKYGHIKTKQNSGKYKCKVCRRNEMQFYNTLNKYINKGGC